MNTRLAVALLGAGLLLGCSGGRGTLLPRDTAVVAFSQEPDILNPYLSPLAATSSISSLFYSGLALVDDHGQWVPDLAERVPSLENGDVTVRRGRMRVTYRLRKASWQDGRPLTSADVAATWKLVMDPRFPGLSRAGYELIQAVETPTPQTVVLVFKQPYAPFLELFPFVLPAHLIAESEHPERAPWNREPIGTGPYKLVRWTSGEKLVAEANPGYFRGKPAIAHLELRFVGDDQSALVDFKAGGLDVYQGAAPTQLHDLQQLAGGHVYQTPSPTWEHLLFNLTHPAVGDLKVRQAIAHLIDRQALNQAAYGGVFRPAWSEVPTWSWAYNPRVEQRYAYDPRRAAALLDQAGWKVGPDGLRARNGQKLQLTLVTTSDKPQRALAAQLFRRQWRDAGIDLAIERLPANAIWGGGGRLAKGTFDLALLASSSRPDPDTSYRWRSDQVPPAGQNRARYRSAEADRLLQAGQLTLSRPTRQRIYAALAERLGVDLPVVPLLYWVGIDATSQRLVGYAPNPTLRGNLWNVWGWKLKP